MRRDILPITSLLLLVLFACPPVSQAQDAELNTLPPAFAPDRVLVAFQPGTRGAEISEAHGQAGGQVLKTLGAIGVQVIAVPAGTVLDTVAVYQRNPNVRFAEPDYFRTFVVPDEGSDPVLGIQDYFNEQWGLHNIGQALTDPGTGSPTLSGTPDADIDAPEGWDISTGSSDIVIAILDSGIDCNSVELNGKCLGAAMNFVPEYEDLADILGHGTHVAGIAAANTDNGIGIAGVGWNSSIVSLKVCYGWPDLIPLIGVCPVSASIEAITHAADMGYDVINMSYGSDEVDANGAPIALAGHSQAEAEAVSYAWSNNVVLVAAAGNNADTTLSYPAAYPEVIAVAATNSGDNLASFSSFGNSWVSVAAPGENILSTYPDAACAAVLPGYDPGESCLTWQSGSSMASPHVAGAASLVRDLVGSNEEARYLIESSADQLGASGQNFLAWTQHGRLNLYNALAASQGANNPPTANFSFSCRGTACEFDGTASSDPDGDIASYDWDFGDGNTGSGGIVAHSYASSGTYTVSLIVTDSADNFDTASTSLRAKNKGRSEGDTGGGSESPGGGGSFCDKHPDHKRCSQ
jgi:thermitase